MILERKEKYFMDYPHSDFYCAVNCITGSNRANGEYHSNRVYCQSAADCFCNDLRPCVWPDRRGCFPGYGKVFKYWAVVGVDTVYHGGKHCACAALAFHRQSGHWREEILRLYCRADFCRRRKVFGTLYRDSTNSRTHIFRLAGAASCSHFQYVFHSAAYHRLNWRGVGGISIPEIEKGCHWRARVIWTYKK